MPLVVQPPQTASFTATANSIHPVDCTSANVTATLPTLPADNATVTVLLTAATAPFVCTVTCGGSSRFNITGGGTSTTLVNPGDVCSVTYEATGDLWMMTTVPLRNLADGTQITWDTSTAGQIKPVLAPNLVLNSIRLANVMMTSARCCTTYPLTTTYNNGSNGAGATLTATANGVIPTIDNCTIVANDRILVNNQTNAFENGIYVATSIGAAGAPFVLTRATDVDVAPDINGGVEVRIQEGVIWGTSLLRSFPSAPPITLGTTPIRFNGPVRAQINGADLAMGTGRDRKQVFHEFVDMSTTAITVNATKTPAGAWVYVSGTAAQAAQNEGAEAVIDGLCELSTGTDTTGRVAIGAFKPAAAVNWAAASRYRFFGRMKIPTLTVNTTNMFVTRIGFLDPTLAAHTAGLYFELPADASTVKCVAMSASTATTVDSTFAQNTAFRVYVIDYDENTGYAYFYISTPNPTLVASINTNLPVNATTMVPSVWMLKSSGTTAGTARIDVLSGILPDSRLPGTLVGL